MLVCSLIMATLIDIMGGGKMQPQGDLAGNWLDAAKVPWNLLKQGVAGTGSPAESIFNMLGVDMPPAEPITLDQQMLDVMTATSPIGGMFGGASAKGFSRAKNKFPGLADSAKRFEISDRQAKLSGQDLGQIKALFSNGDVPQGDVVNGRLGQLFKHKKLYKQYPELAELRLQFKQGSDSLIGRTKDGKPIINIGVDQSDDEIVNSLLHEINHNISEIEGWPIGGSPDEFGPSRDALAKEWNKAKQDKPNKYKEVFDARQAARDRYLRQADEAQAEEVVSRRKMTSKQRKKNPPFRGLDPNDYEVRYSDELE